MSCKKHKYDEDYNHDDDEDVDDYDDDHDDDDGDDTQLEPAGRHWPRQGEACSVHHSFYAENHHMLIYTMKMSFQETVIC